MASCLVWHSLPGLLSSQGLQAAALSAFCLFYWTPVPDGWGLQQYYQEYKVLLNQRKVIEAYYCDRPDTVDYVGANG